jgi:hypothetical protein
MAITYRGERFSGYNKPKRTPGKNKKFAVLAKKGETVRLVRFGDPNMTIKNGKEITWQNVVYTQIFMQKEKE